MHPALFPLSLVTSAIRPSKLSHPIPVVSLVESLVGTAVRPPVPPLTMHHVVFPITDVVSPVWPLVVAMAAHLVSDPLSCVRGLIGPHVGARAVFLALCEDAFKVRPIIPALTALPMIEVVPPLTHISLPLIRRGKRPLPISQIIPPLPLVLIPVRTAQCPHPMRRIIKPLPLILGLVRPGLNALAALAIFLV